MSYLSIYTTEKYNRLYEQQAAKDYRAEAQEYFDDRCRGEGLSRDEIIACFYESISTAREAERTEQDLQAQREMAEWAADMWGVSFVGLFVGIAGTIAVALTLRQTNRALEIARKGHDLSEEALADTKDTNKRALRAYICHDCTNLIMGGFPHVRVTVKNTGQTPTTIEKMIYRITTVNKIRDYSYPTTHTIAPNAYIGGNGDTFSCMLTLEKGGVKLSDGTVPTDEINIHLIFEMTYRDVFSHLHTFGMKLIRRGDEPGHRFSMPTEAESKEDWYDLKWEPRRR